MYDRANFKRYSYFYIYKCDYCHAYIHTNYRTDYAILGDYYYFNTLGIKKTLLMAWSYEANILLCKNSKKGYEKAKIREKFQDLLL